MQANFTAPIDPKISLLYIYYLTPGCWYCQVTIALSRPKLSGSRDTDTARPCQSYPGHSYLAADIKLLPGTNSPVQAKIIWQPGVLIFHFVEKTISQKISFFSA